jgi:glycolate oxidase iron-sulfur subunit
MHATLIPSISCTPTGERAAEILKSCVHCGFCNATCPTYRLLGNELDGPRGRIYQIKSLLEGEAPSPSVQLHLDRCLGCRACETTCPSGVAYSELLDTGREMVEEALPRPVYQRLLRRALRRILPDAVWLSRLMRLARAFRWLMPSALAAHVPPPPADPGAWPPVRHPRRAVALAGCVQAEATPRTNAAAARVLDRAGISLAIAPGTGCCGALSHHLGVRDEGLELARRNIEVWHAALEEGAEAIVASASGCGAHLREYGRLFAGDGAMALKAQRVAAAVRDLSEVVPPELAQQAAGSCGVASRIAVHSPCTLVHAQRLGGRVESLLGAAGCELSPVLDGGICCGSAGSYSILQPELAARLGSAKADALQAGSPDLIVTANIGCQLHIAQHARLPVHHWIEILDERLAALPQTQGSIAP